MQRREGVSYRVFFAYSSFSGGVSGFGGRAEALLLRTVEGGGINNPPSPHPLGGLRIAIGAKDCPWGLRIAPPGLRIGVSGRIPGPGGR